MRIAGIELTTTLVVAEPIADPCRALHERSFCMDNGYCFGLFSDDIDALTGNKVPLSCLEAYTDPRVDSLELPLLAEPPIIKSVTAREFTKLVKCESDITNFESLIPHLTNESHVALFDSMLNTADQLKERLRTMYPYVLYDSDVDGETLREFVAGARTIASSALTPLPRELIGAFQCTIFRSGFSKSIRTYLDLYTREIASNPSSAIAKTLLNNLTPFFHAWLKANHFLGIGLPIWTIPSLSIVTTMAQHDPVYPVEAEMKIWSISVAEPTLKATTGAGHILPVVPDEFPISVIDTLSIPDDGVVDAGNFFASRLVELFADHDNAIGFEYLRAAIHYLRFHESATDSDRIRFCTTIEPIMIEIVGKLTSYDPAVITLFGAHGITEYMHLCGSSDLDLNQRVGLFLRVFVGERNRRNAQVYPLEIVDPKVSTLVNALLFVGEIPVHSLQGPIVIVPSRKSTDLIGSRKRRDASIGTKIGASSDDIAKYHHWLSSVVKTAIASFYDSSSQALVRSSTSMDNQMAENLRSFGRVVALLFLEGDPEAVLSSYFSSHHSASLYFDSIAVRRGFCEVVDCNMLDRLVSREDLVNAIELIRGIELLTRPFTSANEKI